HERGIGADLPMFATALVLEAGTERVAIVDVDAIGFDDESVQGIVRAITTLTQIPRHQIRLSWTHTHSGPNTFRLENISQGLDMVESYMNCLEPRIAGAVWQAQQNLRPVRVAAAQGSCNINVNRRLRLPNGDVVIGRNWEGVVDRTVRVVRFDDLEERPA